MKELKIHHCLGWDYRVCFLAPENQQNSILNEIIKFLWASETKQVGAWLYNLKRRVLTLGEKKKKKSEFYFLPQCLLKIKIYGQSLGQGLETKSFRKGGSCSRKYAFMSLVKQSMSKQAKVGKTSLTEEIIISLFRKLFHEQYDKVGMSWLFWFGQQKSVYIQMVNWLKP